MNVHVEIVDGPVQIVMEEEMAGIGARLRFEGIVRPTEDGAALAGLVYETYDPMAEQSLRALAEAALARFEIDRIRVWHSRGLVPVGKRSLLIEVDSQHRGAGLEAMSWYIERLKQTVPIWKHLRYPDGRTQAALGSVQHPPTDHPEQR